VILYVVLILLIFFVRHHPRRPDASFCISSNVSFSLLGPLVNHDAFG
jgi:hypothetical protein